MTTLQGAAHVAARTGTERMAECSSRVAPRSNHSLLRTPRRCCAGSATWQRCRVHFMRNALAHAGRSGRRVVSAFIATAFAQDDPDAAKAQWRRVADQLRPKVANFAP